MGKDSLNFLRSIRTVVLTQKIYFHLRDRPEINYQFHNDSRWEETREGLYVPLLNRSRRQGLRLHGIP